MGRLTTGDSSPGGPSAGGFARSEGEAACRRMLLLLLEGSRVCATALAQELYEHRGVRFLYEEVVVPALEEVGRLWEAREVSVADEHLATATAQAAVAALYPRFPAPARGPPVVLGCVQGERHDFGARLVADLLVLDGWEDQFLGADVPLEAFARRVEVARPHLVCVSVTRAAFLGTTQAAVDHLRRAWPSAKICVGGRALANARFCEGLRGADALVRVGSEVVEVVEVARAWK